MKNKTAKQNSKMKESVSGFGCDLTEHLKSSGQDVPQVLKCCAEFIEKHGIVDGIYRLSGITSNIQKLRQEFGSKMCPDLTREVYLQDIHCVGSLCKLYFRELPNPLLTYELYRKFMDSVSVKEEHQQLQCIQSIIRELPLSHYRTLEYLIKHLTHLAAFSSQTNMHTRNLALVWAPNLLRSKENEAPACNGDSAFLEVRVQQTVVEFILNHTEQIFDDKPGQSTQREGGQSSACDGPYVTSGFPAPGQYAPMKLMSLEEARARSLNPNHPAHRECQQDDDFTEISTINTKAYHTVIDMPSNKRSFSGKSKKWKNIFNLGGSTTDTKRKLTWNGSVFIKSSKLSDKARIRPAKSMDSLCSLTKEDSEFKHPSETNGLATAAFKSHTLDSNSSYDLSKPDQVWEFEPEKVLGAMAVIHNTSKTGFKSDSMPRQRKLPEQLKVFKGEDHCHPTSPKNRRMLYPSNLNSGSTRTSFPGKLFPLESSALHQCKAVNISEPFAVSVPLRVSAVISSNSTMCRALDKDKLTHPLTEQISEAPVVEKNSERSTGSSLKKEGIQGGPSTRREAIKGENSELKEGNSKVIMMPLTTKDTTSTRSLHLQTQPSVQVKTLEQDETGKETPSHAYMTPLLPKEFVKSEKKLVGLLKQDPELRKLTEMDEKSGSNRMDEHRADVDLKEIKTNVGDTEDESLSQMTTRSKTSSPASSLPSETSKHNAITLNGNHQTVSYFTLRDMPVRQLSFDKNWDVSHNEEFKEDFKTSLMHPNNVELNKLDLPVRGKTETKSNISLPAAQSQIIFPESAKMYLGATQSHNTKTGESLNVANDELKIKEDCDTFPEKMNKKAEITKKVEHQGEAKNFDQKRSSLSLSQPMDKCLPDNDDEESLGDNTGDLDLVEPWEDSGIRQWVTSPLHSPKILNFFQSEEELLSCLMGESYKSNKCVTEGNQNELSGKSTEKSSGKSLQVYHHKTKTCTENIHSPAWENIQVNEMNQKSKEKDENSPKQINNCSFRRQKRQRSQDNSYTQKADEKPVIKQRPHSLNLNLETLYIKDASEQENVDFLPGVLLSQKSLPKYGSPTLELKKFLCDRQASMRRNSAPVSVSSVRTSFMIKTCQAKAVPVIAPKIQYSQIPQPMVVNNANCLPNKELENDLTENGKTKTDATSPLPSTSVKIKQSGQPASTNLLNASNGYGTPCPKKPSVLRTSSNGEAIGDFVRQERSTVMKRPSFRARPNRPQSLILFSPPFPIMDCPPSGDDYRIHLSPIRSPTEVVAPDTFSKEFAEFDSVSLRNKMTMPKSGQRLETSTSCFYQPQRRSMIFDNRGKTD